MGSNIKDSPNLPGSCYMSNFHLESPRLDPPFVMLYFPFQPWYWDDLFPLFGS
uniref:Uncharacterized protein n=1 Tax=Romanomermis culicivorax TaxID=13658 RepID=A0A915IVZ9_ROMCU